ncbi:unnamed protein product [Lactuca virosa]|uniref:Uncharacterized protein n=1 Tax=Lactuca virosa TaxID=75947 RepID=A0AAU9M6Z3_9ASTR|nr:unnamed protein product [Lactuca virosa]
MGLLRVVPTSPPPVLPLSSPTRFLITHSTSDLCYLPTASHRCVVGSQLRLQMVSRSRRFFSTFCTSLSSYDLLAPPQSHRWHRRLLWFPFPLAFFSIRYERYIFALEEASTDVLATLKDKALKGPILGSSNIYRLGVSLILSVSANVIQCFLFDFLFLSESETDCQPQIKAEGNWRKNYQGENPILWNHVVCQ